MKENADKNFDVLSYLSRQIYISILLLRNIINIVRFATSTTVCQEITSSWACQTILMVWWCSSWKIIIFYVMTYETICVFHFEGHLMAHLMESNFKYDLHWSYKIIMDLIQTFFLIILIIQEYRKDISFFLFELRFFRNDV